MLFFRKCKNKVYFTVSLSLLFFFFIGTFPLTGSFNLGERLYFQDNHRVQDHLRSPSFQGVGYQRTFWSYNFTASLYYEINATLLAVGVHSYIFMQNSCIAELGESIASEQAEIIRDEFDNTIYPRVTDLAGHPNGTLGDIDNDPRIAILLSSNPMSYYSQRNELPLDYSNQCEMFYIYNYLHKLPFYLFTTIAHEFHHLVWFNNEMDEPQFILEALAEYATYHTGYLAPYDNISSRVKYFLPHPEDSLLCFNVYNDGDLTVAIDYGSGYLFAFYIAEHYGVNILRNLITESADGAHGIEAVLQAAGNNITFNDLYLNWITALTIDEVGFQNNLYGFESLDAQISSYDYVDELPLLNETVSLRYYGFHIHKLHSPPDNFAVQIKKLSNQTIGVSLAFHDTFGWHIHQHLHDEAETIVTDNFSGSSIDQTYLITSYISNHTPTVPTNYGLGPLTDIKISIIQSPNTATTISTDTKITSTLIPTPTTSTTSPAPPISTTQDTNNVPSFILLEYSFITLLFGISIMFLWNRKNIDY